MSSNFLSAAIAFITFIGFSMLAVYDRLKAQESTNAQESTQIIIILDRTGRPISDVIIKAGNFTELPNQFGQVRLPSNFNGTINVFCITGKKKLLGSYDASGSTHITIVEECD